MFLIGIFMGIVIGIAISQSVNIKNNSRGELLMSVVCKTIEKIAFDIEGAVDAKGNPVALPDGTVYVWTIDEVDGQVCGTVEIDAADPKKGTFVAGAAGATGKIKVVATLPDGVVIVGESDDILIAAAEAVSFVVKLGDPVV